MLAGSIERVSGITETLAMGMDLLPLGICAIDCERRVLFANRAARMFFENGQIIGVSDGFLRPVSRAHERVVSNFLSRVAESPAQAAAFQFARPGQKPVSFLLLPYLFRPLSDVRPVTSGAMLVFGDPQWPYEYNTSLVGSLFGFTPTEAKIAALLMQGKSVEQICSAQGVTANTVRNQLKRMFTKTDARTQADLTRTLLQSPAHLTVWPDLGLSIPLQRSHRNTHPQRARTLAGQTTTPEKAKRARN